MSKPKTPVIALIWTLLLASTALAADVSPVCRVLLAQEQFDRDDLALNARLAESELVAHEEIFVLLDGLWKSDAVERLLYLEGKHNRDIAKLNRKQCLLLLERQDALIEQYRLLCGDDASTAANDRAHARYLKAECDQLANRAEIAKVDLDFTRVQEESVLNLRASGVATRQQVILAELAVANGRQELADAERRVRQCSVGKTAPAVRDAQ